MSDALQQLIDAVEAGKAITSSDAMNGLSRGLGYDEAIEVASDAVKAFGGSLDAAKALHEALLPGWMLPCVVSHYVNGSHGVTVELYQRDGAGETVATNDSMARAWLLAILKAYRQEAARE